MKAVSTKHQETWYDIGAIKKEMDTVQEDVLELADGQAKGTERLRDTQKVAMLSYTHSEMR